MTCGCRSPLSECQLKICPCVGTRQISSKTSQCKMLVRSNSTTQITMSRRCYILWHAGSVCNSSLTTIVATMLFDGNKGHHLTACGNLGILFSTLDTAFRPHNIPNMEDAQDRLAEWCPLPNVSALDTSHSDIRCLPKPVCVRKIVSGVLVGVTHVLLGFLPAAIHFLARLFASQPSTVCGRFERLQRVAQGRRYCLLS